MRVLIATLILLLLVSAVAALDPLRVGQRIRDYNHRIEDASR